MSLQPPIASNLRLLRRYGRPTMIGWHRGRSGTVRTVPPFRLTSAGSRARYCSGGWGPVSRTPRPGLTGYQACAADACTW